MTNSKKEKMVKVVVLRDFWPEEGKRVIKGTEIEVTADQAMEGMESGMLQRVK